MSLLLTRPGSSFRHASSATQILLMCPKASISLLGHGIPSPPESSTAFGAPGVAVCSSPASLPCLLSFPPLAGTPLQLASSNKFSVPCHCHEQVKVHWDLVLVDRGLDWRVLRPECEPSGPAPRYLHNPSVGEGCGECGTPTGFSFSLDPHILRSCPSPKWIP